MSADSAKIWQSRLKDGEVILWTGQPTNLALCIKLLIIALIYAGIAAMTWPFFHALMNQSGRNPALFFPIAVAGFLWFIMAIPATLLGVYAQHYAITNLRALVLTRIGFSMLWQSDLTPETKAVRAAKLSWVEIVVDPILTGKKKKRGQTFVGMTDEDYNSILGALKAALRMRFDIDANGQELATA